MWGALAPVATPIPTLMEFEHLDVVALNNDLYSVGGYQADITISFIMVAICFEASS